MAKWMRLQSGEEATHAGKFFDLWNDRGGRVLISAIDQPPTTRLTSFSWARWFKPLLRPS